MLVSICLALAVNGTVFWRRVMMACMTLYYFKNGEFVAPFLYFTGALLAEVANAQTSKNDPSSTEARWKRIVREKGPMTLFVVSYFFATQPPEGHERVPYSLAIYNFSQKYLTPAGGSSLPNHRTDCQVPPREFSAPSLLWGL